MKLEKGQISTGQILFLASSFCLGATLLKTPAVGAGHADWLAIILGLMEGLFWVYIFTSLIIKFPGKTLVEINTLIYGPFLGNFISLAYLFYFFILATLTLRLFGDFFVGLIYTQTPVIVIIGLVVFLCASAVRNGIEVIARCSQVLLPITIVTLIITIIFALPQIEINRFLPLFNVSWAEFIKITHYTAVFPFGESITFLMFLAFLGSDREIVKKGRLSMMLGLILGGISMVLVAARNTSLLGDTKIISNYSSYQAVRLIDIADVLTRIEIIVSLNFLTMGFLVVSIFYYSSALGLAQILKLRSYLPLILPIGILLVCISITQFENMFEYERFSKIYSTYLALPFQIGFPIISLLICKIKGIPKK